VLQELVPLWYEDVLELLPESPDCTFPSLATIFSVLLLSISVSVDLMASLKQDPQMVSPFRIGSVEEHH
jgi:hypothetical protein